MGVLLEMTQTLLAAAGLLGLGWFCFEKLLGLPDSEAFPVWAVVAARGAGESLEQTVRVLEKQIPGCPVVLLDLGLDEEGRQLAALLQRRWPDLERCTPEELKDYIT